MAIHEPQILLRHLYFKMRISLYLQVFWKQAFVVINLVVLSTFSTGITTCSDKAASPPLVYLTKAPIIVQCTMSQVKKCRTVSTTSLDGKHSYLQQISTWLVKKKHWWFLWLVSHLPTVSGKWTSDKCLSNIPLVGTQLKKYYEINCKAISILHISPWCT